ncbi:MAG: hypothetical protein HRU25_11605 [Psychrobium sp.]|nr:hypothetical protein [Psychrobium sp.]
MSNASCQACDLLNWDHFSNISFGLWDEDQQYIVRKNKLYPLAQCLSCGHVQVSTKYDNTETTPRLEIAINTAVDTVVHYQARCIAKRQRLEKTILDSVYSEKNLGSWKGVLIFMPRCLTVNH